MAAIANAWRAASRRQKIIIAGALLISVVALVSLTNPSTSGPAALGQATPTPSACDCFQPYVDGDPDAHLEADPHPDAQRHPDAHPGTRLGANPAAYPRLDGETNARPDVYVAHLAGCSGLLRQGNRQDQPQHGVHDRCRVQVRSIDRRWAGPQDREQRRRGILDVEGRQQDDHRQLAGHGDLLVERRHQVGHQVPEGRVRTAKRP